MKKYLLFLPIFGIFIPILVVIILKIQVFLSQENDLEILNILNDKELVISSSIKIPKLEINNLDYVGSIKILNKQIVVQDKCQSFFTHQSSCLYSSSPLIILGTNLSNSFSSFKLYNVGDKIDFINTIGFLYQFEIVNIVRINDLVKLKEYDSDLLIVIKNYNELEYIVLDCKRY